jgi:hypothetical protein
MGDLNYRINLDLDEIKGKIHNNDIDSLFEYDQLNIEINKKRLNINGFREGLLTHKPTYKYKGCDYNLIKIPGWTDRILFKAKENITLYSYTSIDQNNSSDHKPVYASMKFSLNSESENFDENKLCLII